MSKNASNLERVTITLPKGLVTQMEHRVATQMFASLSEWIRYAIREQLQRDQAPLQLTGEEQARLQASVRQVKAGKHSKFEQP